MSHLLLHCVEQYLFPYMRRVSSNCCGMLMCIETVGCYWYLISYGREGINNKHLQEVKKKNMYTVSLLLIKALLVVGLTISRFWERPSRASCWRFALAGQQEQSLRHCFNMPMNSFEMISVLQPEESLHLTFQYPVALWTIFLMP